VRLRTLVAALLLLLPGCKPDTSALDALVGVWSADDPRFEGKTLRFSRDWLVLGLGEREEVCRIRRVSVADRLGAEDYRVEYTNAEGVPMTLAFTCAPDNSIRLRNQGSVVWRRGSRKP
jgi:hypothetical protein